MAKMTWHTMPQDAGQMVHVEYAADDTYLYRRTTDRSLPVGQQEILERVDWEWLAPEADFEPWNGSLGCEVDDSDFERC